MPANQLPARPRPTRAFPSPRPLQVAAVAAVALSALLSAPDAQARITRIAVDAAKSESPTFGGYSWPDVGQYEKIVGVAYGEVNPLDPKNAVIADIKLAPRNARGNVEYSFDFYILKPVKLNKGAHKMMYEPPNRGGKQYASLNRSTGGNDPAGQPNCNVRLSAHPARHPTRPAHTCSIPRRSHTAPDERSPRCAQSSLSRS